MGVRPNRFRLIGAVHLFLLEGDRVLLLRRFNTDYEDGKYSVIAAHLDGNEEIIHATCREAWEEAGVRITSTDLSIVGVMHRRAETERIDFFLTTTRWAGTIVNREPDKCDVLAWFPLDALPETMVPYVHRGLENYRAGRTFDSFGWD